MKRIKIIVLLVLIGSYPLRAQSVNFSSYDKVTNGDFKKFLNLFSKKNLPISTDQIVSTLDIWNLKGTPLSQTLIDKYLMDEGGLITGPLYSDEPDEGIPAHDVVGVFYPLYKLPTNGNYVLLVFAQAGDKREMECAGLVITLSYDLNGNFLYVSNYTYRPGTENINAYIDENLQSHMIYVYNEVNGEPVFPPLDTTFSAEQAHMTDQINTDGRSTKVSFTKTPGQFKFSSDECRFKLVN